MSVSDLMYLFSITMMIPLGTACAREKVNNKSESGDFKVCYVVYMLYIWLSDFLTSCLALLNIIIEIFVTVQRILLISTGALHNQTRPTHRPLVVCATFFAISLAIYSPVLFMHKVRSEETRNETTSSVRKDYFYERTEFGKSKGALFLVESITIVRFFLVIVVLTIVNIVASIIYAAYYKKKRATIQAIRGLS
jgi:phosphatidylglycerophosphate synthase